MTKIMQTYMKNAHAAGKAAADPERFSGDGSAPRRAFRRVDWFPAFGAFAR